MILNKLFEGEVDMSVDYTVTRDSNGVWIDIVAVKVTVLGNPVDVYKQLGYETRERIARMVESAVDLGTMVSGD